MSDAARKAPPLDLAAAVQVTLHPRVGGDWPRRGVGPIHALAAQLPSPSDFPPGTWIAVSPGAPPRTGLWRVVSRSPVTVHLAARCTALLARGYSDVCADATLAYGRVP
jgi:hypothetical protein